MHEKKIAHQNYYLILTLLTWICTRATSTTIGFTGTAGFGAVGLHIFRTSGTVATFRPNATILVEVLTRLVWRLLFAHYYCYMQIIVQLLPHCLQDFLQLTSIQALLLTHSPFEAAQYAQCL